MARGYLFHGGLVGISDTRVSRGETWADGGERGGAARAKPCGWVVGTGSKPATGIRTRFELWSISIHAASHLWPRVEALEAMGSGRSTGRKASAALAPGEHFLNRFIEAVPAGADQGRVTDG